MTTTAEHASGKIAPFTNETVKDFRDPADAAAMKAALAEVKSQFGRHYPLVIGGRRIETEKKIRSLNPANPDEVIGLTSAASKEQANEAIEAAARAFESWRRLTLAERAEYIFKAARLLRERRFQYDALLVYEVGKSWPEADGDIAEAIDFLEFYAREALRFAQPQPVVPIEGEQNEMVYIPLGVGAVIPPWNFAGAIMMGMTAAAIVSGNTVVLKPSSDAAVIAAWFVDLLEEIGVPQGRGELCSRFGQRDRRSDCHASGGSLHLVYRFQGSRSAHQRAGRQTAARPKVDQARRRRDGR